MRRGRGFSLVETVVAVALGTIVAIAGLAITRDFHRFHARHTSELEAAQGLREALELIAEDVRNAGVGVGYQPEGRFAGFLTGTLELPGGARFQAEGRSVSTVDGSLPVDDLGIRRALGQRRTILYLEDGTGEICAGLGLEPRTRVAVTSRNGLTARTLLVLGASASACTRGICSGGCDRITWSGDDAYVSDPRALISPFTGGDLFADFETVVWFVAADASGQAQLRRHVAETGCPSLDETCGGKVAPGVELLQYELWRFDAETRTWARLSHAGPIETLERLRVDLELVVRGRSDPGVGRTPPVTSQLAPGVCLPAPCGSEHDGVPRMALRTTVEVRNAGRFRLQ